MEGFALIDTGIWSIVPPLWRSDWRFLRRRCIPPSRLAFLLAGDYTFTIVALDLARSLMRSAGSPNDG